MSGDRRRAALPSRLAWTLPALFLCMLMPGRAGVTAGYGGTGAAGVIMALVLFALPLAYTVPRGRVLWDRHRRLLLTTQVVLTCLPFVVFGERWVVGLSGLLGGLLLLTMTAPVSWLLFGGVLAAEGVLRIGVFGLYPASDISYVAWVFTVPLDIALPLFGLVRLSDMVSDLRAARTELAGLAVIRERAGAAARLRTAVGDRLGTVTARARAALAILAHDPDPARAYLAEAAVVARQAVAQVRRVVVEDRDAPGTPATGPSGDIVAPRLAMLVLVLFMSVYSVQHMVNLAVSTAALPTKVVGTASIVAIVALQLYHCMASRSGRRPRVWGLTLAVQASLPFVVFLTAGEARVAIMGMVAFPAGSALLLLTGWLAWVVFAILAVSMGVLWPLSYTEAVAATTYSDAAYLVGLAASTGLAVYGLSRLTDLAVELEVTRRDLASAAVERERLRVAQDTHDLLGQGLSVMALKCDLAERLIGRDEARARAELAALIQLEAGIRADMWAVTSGMHGLSLRAELVAAHEVLVWAGIEVDIRRDPVGVPEEIDGLLATVLREAVTNTLRHANATWCAIELTGGPDAADLRVANDGVSPERREPGSVDPPERAGPRPAGGHGLTNLAARAASVGGHLTTHVEDGRFEVTVHVPLPVAAPGRPGGNEVLAVKETLGGAAADREA